MAFATKTDYCGLAAITELSNALVVKDDAVNLTARKYQPVNQEGSFISTEVFGEDSAPPNNYGVKADITLAAGKIKLNSIVTVGTSPNEKKYALESVTITTSAGAAPTVAATCQQVESAATDASQCHYSVPSLSLTKKHHAQILFGAFELTGAGCHLTECTATVGGTISKEAVAGVKISSDINSAVITVSGKILQSGNTVPTFEETDGWVVTQPLNCTNPETEYKSYSFEVQKVLAKDAVVAAAG